MSDQNRASNSALVRKMFERAGSASSAQVAAAKNYVTSAINPHRNNGETESAYNARLEGLVPSIAGIVSMPIVRASHALGERALKNPENLVRYETLMDNIAVHSNMVGRQSPRIYETVAKYPEIIKWFYPPEGGMAMVSPTSIRETLENFRENPSLAFGAPEFFNPTDRKTAIVKILTDPELKGQVKQLIETKLGPTAAGALSWPIPEKSMYSYLPKKYQDKVLDFMAREMAHPVINLPMDNIDVLAHEYGHINDISSGATLLDKLTLGKLKDPMSAYISAQELLAAQAHYTLAKRLPTSISEPMNKILYNKEPWKRILGRTLLGLGQPLPAFASVPLATSETVQNILRKDSTGIGGSIADFADQHPALTAVSGFIPQLAVEAMATIRGSDIARTVPGLNTAPAIVGNLLRNGLSYSSYMAAPAIAGLIASYRAKARHAKQLEDQNVPQ